MNRLACSIVAFVVVAGSSCADELLTATFTSRVVQLESCKTVGEADEGCARDESVAELRTDLVEVEKDTFWLYGLPRGGIDDRALLGTRDQGGGFLFVDENTQTDSATGCSLTTRVQLSLAVDPDRADDVGTDDCIALVGRQIDETTSTPGCDATSVPPQEIVRTLRQRWEPLDDASTCGK